MKFSEQWLREWVDPGVTTHVLAARLTMAGLEVEATEPAGAELGNVVTAVVREVVRHPDAERLSVCKVFDGSSEWQVVCGAANVRPGLKVALAREGAQLPGITIRRATLRGVESCGMLCSADELGLEASRAEGLLELPADIAPGLPVATLFGGDDCVFGLKLTPNRGDCLGMAGLAREVGALYCVAVREPDCSPVPATINDVLDVTLAAPDACPRYAGRIIRGVNVAAPSPLWLQERLRRAGVRSIDAVVDVTNYVMLELGQPMHAFDCARLTGPIGVRRAKPGEQLELLDGNTLELQADALLITDASGPVALAGIMGGERSAVGATTRDIFLEAAFFAPLALAGKARAVGMQTDASQRFERGVDFRMQAVAIERATRLLLDIVGGAPGPVIIACAEDHLPRLDPIRLRAARLDMMLGLTVPAVEVEDILCRLGLDVVREADGWRVTPTSFRFDLRIEADLIEEIGRVYGYERIPVRVQANATPIRPRPEARLELHDMRRRLIALGYQEAITYSFVESRLQALLDPGVEPVAVANPISADMAVMRTTLWAGLLKALQHNQNRQQRRVRLFETGLRFLPTAEGLQQRPAIAAVASGERLPENWVGGKEMLDFFDIRGDVEALLDGGQGFDELRVVPAEHPALHPGQSALLCCNGQDAGYLGALHPELETALGLQGPVYLFELDVQTISRKNLPSFKALSKFPEVRRDIAILVDREQSAESVLKTARLAAGPLLVDLKLFDVYRGQGIDEKQKSFALGVVLQDRERTLTDAQVGTVIDAIVAALARHCGAIPRV